MKIVKPLVVSFTAVFSAIVWFSTSALAVEDGLGTNVVRNIRIQPAGVIDLGGTPITNWVNLPTTTGGVSRVEYLAWSNAVQGSTGALNSATGTLNTAVGLLNDATNALNTRVNTDLANATNELYNALYNATNTLNALINATNALNTRVNTDLANATNNLYNATNALNLNKLDKLNGTAGNLTVTGTFVQAVAASTQIVLTAGSAIQVNDTFIPIVCTNGAGDITASLASGTTAGQIIILQGQDDSHTVTLTNNPGLVVLCSGVDFTFKSNNTMQLIWNNGKWIELDRVAP